MRTYLSARDSRALLSLTNLIYSLPDREQVLGAVSEALRTLVPYSSAVYLAMNTVGFREEGHLLLGVGVKELEAFTGYYAALHPFTRSGWIHHANGAARITDFVPASRIPDTEYGRDFMTRGPFSWETGVILQAQGDPVGALCLHRQKPDRDFSDRDLLVVDSLAPHLARVLQHFDLLEQIRSGEISSDSGLLAKEADGKVSLNAVAMRVLSENPEFLSSGIPASPATLVLRSSGIPYRVRTTLGGPGKGRIILFEPLPHSESLPERLSSWDLTDRQREIVLYLIRGASNREIADHLSLTEQTVKDHLKAIYDKVGVRNRAQLTARVYSAGAGQK
jgi:DNA-binding CsgD family transcriptional regulator